MSPTLFDKSRDMAMSPWLLGASAILLIAYALRTILARSQKLDFPTVGDPNDTDCRAALAEGSAKYPNTPFIISSNPPIVILPFSTLDEVRNIPEHTVSFREEVSRMFYAKYTGINNNAPALFGILKGELTRHVASTIDALQDELRYAISKEFGSGETWTKVVLYEKLLHIVALLSGRVFVGRPVSRNEDWINSSISYTVDCIAASENVPKYSALVRYFGMPFTREIRKIKEHRTKSAELLKPVIEKCIERSKEGKGGAVGGEDEEFDDEQGTFVGWILKHTEPKKRKDPLALAQNQLSLSFAAIHTTSMVTYHALVDLAAHPEYIAPLREEIERVIAEDGYSVDESGTKKLKKQSFPKLTKMDSFLKESQRFNPLGLVANTRRTTSPLHLSTGHTIPKGTRIAYNLHQLNLKGPDVSSLPHNPSTLPAQDPPSKFSPFRYSSLRSTPGNESKYQFVTTNKESLNFGYGNHQCLGRFFASAEIKVVMVGFLLGWDIRLVGDKKRPANYMYDTVVSPDPFAEVEIRRRVV